MKKLIILLLLPLISFSQAFKRTETGFSNVFKTDKTIEEVYGKSKEWIAINFKSANDVIQLDTSDKIIVKGKLPFSQNSQGYKVDFIGDITITISIREGRYKVDIDLDGQVYSVAFPSNKSNWETVGAAQGFNKEELLPFIINTLNNSPYLSKKQKEKGAKEAMKNIDNLYSEYLANEKLFNSYIESLFNSINSEVNSTEDDW